MRTLETTMREFDNSLRSAKKIDLALEKGNTTERYLLKSAQAGYEERAVHSLAWLKNNGYAQEWQERFKLFTDYLKW